MQNEKYMSESLKQFYRDYAEWLENGAPKSHSCFKRYFGLCTSLDYWCRERLLCEYVIESLSVEMQYHFKDAGLNVEYPFNDGHSCYRTEFVCEISHLNENRRQWVFDHV